MRRKSSIALIVGLLAGVAGMLTFPGDAQACDRNNLMSNGMYAPNYSTSALYNNSLKNSMKKQRKRAMRAARMANNNAFNSLGNPYASNILAGNGLNNLNGLNGLNGCPNSLAAAPYMNNPYAVNPTLVNNPYGYGSGNMGNMPYANQYSNPYANNILSNSPLSGLTGAMPMLNNGAVSSVLGRILNNF